MTMIDNGRRTGDFLLSEARGTLSREEVTVTVTGSQLLLPGTVLGKVTASGKYVRLDAEADDGSETAAGVLFSALPGVDGDHRAVAIVRFAEVNASRLVADDVATAIESLAAFDVIARSGPVPGISTPAL